MNIQYWFPLGCTGWISLQSKGLSRIFTNMTVQKHQFFSAQPSPWSNSHIHTWLLEKPWDSLVTKTCPSLATPWNVACQAPLSMGFSRQYWSGLPFPSAGNLPDTGIKPRSPASQVDSLRTELWEENHISDYTDLCWQSNVSALNMLYTFVIAFLPRSKCFLTSWLQSQSAVILEPKKIKAVTVSIVSPSICHEVMGLDAMNLIFWMLSFNPAFSLSFFTFIKSLFSSSLLSTIRVVSSAYLRLLIFLPAILIPACTHPTRHFACHLYIS